MKIEPGLEEKFKFLNDKHPETMAGVLGIEFISLTKDCVVATMPVDSRTVQPFGLLHGGASVALSETLCSIGAWMNIDESKHLVVGIEINANHIRAIRGGLVTGTATPVHIGRQTHVWETIILSDAGKTVCTSRCTLAVSPLEKLNYQPL